MMQEHTATSTPTPADQLRSGVVGPAITPKVICCTPDTSTWPTVHVSPRSMTEYLDALELPTYAVPPSRGPRAVNLLDPIALLGVPASPNVFVVGTPGTGHAVLSKETR